AVTQYDEQGFLPDAVVNYLARLGWSHGDDEIFDRQQLVRWFDGSHLSQSPAQFDPDKLRWLNAHYLKATADAKLAELVAPRLRLRGVPPESSPVDLAAACALFKERAATLEEPADHCLLFSREPRQLNPQLDAELAPRIDERVSAGVADLAARLE